MVWDVDALEAEITAAVDGYAAVVAAEHVAVETEFVAVVLRLDGVLREVVVDPRAPARRGLDGLAELVTEAIRTAEREADRRRAELAEKVTFLGHPVLEVVREMISDPQAAARRLATDVHSGGNPWP